MSTSVIPLSISIVCAVCAIIFFIIAFIREDNNKANIIAGFCVAIISVISMFQIRVSEPSIEPRSEQVPTDKRYLEISIHSTEPNYVKLLYSFEGDPKYNNKNEYNDKFTIFESTTVCARNKFLFWWSDMDEKSYEFTEAPITEYEKNDGIKNDIRVIEEVKQIQDKYYSLPDPNSLPEPTSDQPINKCYDDNNMKIIKVYCGYGNTNYSRMYYYENDQIYFALIYFKGKEEHRLYFKEDSIIRYKDEKGIIYDADKEEIVCEWTKFALEDSYEVLNKTEK